MMMMKTMKKKKEVDTRERADFEEIRRDIQVRTIRHKLVSSSSFAKLLMLSKS